MVQEPGTISLGRRFGRCRFEVGLTPKLRTMYASKTSTLEGAAAAVQGEICFKNGLMWHRDRFRATGSSDLLQYSSHQISRRHKPKPQTSRYRRSNMLFSTQTKSLHVSATSCPARVRAAKEKQTWSESGSHGLPNPKPGPVDAQSAIEVCLHNACCRVERHCYLVPTGRVAT